jgi:hypothetical protein
MFTACTPDSGEPPAEPAAVYSVMVALTVGVTGRNGGSTKATAIQMG